MFVDLKRQYRASLKSMDTEEHIDLYFYRPIGFAWAYLFRKLGIRPNAVTIASIFIGIAGGICFYYNDMAINCLGMLLIVWANSFDSADGQLARLTGDYSRLGRILDGLSSELWFITIYIAICLHEVHFSPWFANHGWAIWVLAAAAGASHVQQARMADYYRQFHLSCVRGSGKSELEDSADLAKSLGELSWKHNFWKKLIQTSYYNYTLSQEKATPEFQALRRKLRERWPSANVPVALRQQIRCATLPLMKYTNILSFNWRAIVLFTTVAIRQPWLYFVFELVVLNAILVYMCVRHERICRRFLQQIINEQLCQSETKTS